MRTILSVCLLILAIASGVFFPGSRNLVRAQSIQPPAGFYYKFYAIGPDTCLGANNTEVYGNQEYPSWGTFGLRVQLEGPSDFLI